MERKWDRVGRADLNVAISTIQHTYSPEMSRMLIEYFHERLQDDENYDAEMLAVLMKLVFARMMAGDSADQAFGLKLKRGKYVRKGTEPRDMGLFAAVELLRRRGATWESAVYDVSTKYQKSERVVQRACKRFRIYLDVLSIEVLESLQSVLET